MRARVTRTLAQGGYDHDFVAANKAPWLADNRAVCSCHLCGNPRRHFGRQTRAEAVADLATREQCFDPLTDIGNELCDISELTCYLRDIAKGVAVCDGVWVPCGV